MLIPWSVDVPMWRRPWVNWHLIAGIVGVSVAGFYDEKVFLSLMATWTDWLLHAGWIHLAGNMLFLWVFGNAVNYKFVQLGYLGLFLACAWGSGAIHNLMSGGQPAVGASGAVYGLMGAFLVFFPKNDVKMLLFIRVYPVVFSVSSLWIILLWVAWDVAMLALGLAGRVAIWAHVGGFAVGFAIATLCALANLIKPTEDEQTLLQVLRIRD